MFCYKLKNGHYLKIMPDELCDNPRNFDNLFKFFGKTRTIGSPDSIDGIDDKFISEADEYGSDLSDSAYPITRSSKQMIYILPAAAAAGLHFRMTVASLLI